MTYPSARPMPSFTASVPLLLIAWLLFAPGCAKPPESLSVAELPGAMQQAFTKAKPEIKKMADQAVAAFQKEDWARALVEFQSLCAVPELTDKQRNIASRCLLTVNESLQAAEAAGDQKAAQIRQFHRSEK